MNLIPPGSWSATPLPYYTNVVPVNETVGILCDNIFSMTTDLHTFNKENFSNLLLLAVSNSYFLFNACLYKQLYGLAMGNPLTSALASVSCVI